ncbi:TPA: hypothetical protein ACHVHV_004407, partial [Shigella flexneri]
GDIGSIMIFTSIVGVRPNLEKLAHINLCFNILSKYGCSIRWPAELAIVVLLKVLHLQAGTKFLVNKENSG